MTGRAREVRALTGTHMVKWEYRSLLTKKKRFERCLGILVQHQIYTISNTNVNDQQIKKGRYGKGVFIEYKGEMPVLHFTPAYLSQASITRTTSALSKNLCSLAAALHRQIKSDSIWSERCQLCLAWRKVE